MGGICLDDKYDLRLLSLGAGVQSTCVYLMCLEDEFEDVPTEAVFADTHWEPDEVYEHLDRLEALGRGKIPIHRVSAGNLRQDVLDALDKRKSRIGQPPFYVKNLDTQEGMDKDDGGMLWRICTKEYKIEPIQKEIRRLLGYRKGQRIKKRVQQWFGISIDEASRMKDSRVKWIDNYYPLIERRMSREDCVRWMNKRGMDCPRKSACVGCPYHSNSTWVDMKKNRPAEWADVTSFDAALRVDGKRLPGVMGEAYIHRRMLPLEEAVVAAGFDPNQIDLFDQECEGMCGV